ncbi:B3 domain-containing transcription factor VRN1 Protein VERNALIZATION 1 [Vigna angularis]|uniref:B3 domain-containing transcription factor VRN1 Protein VERNALIZATION 1 n=1 Tax=Phaseolus angularis TaxID=3914 RepID=A0A8T0KM19_PHAAN|nr:B3 domain-containing transcription factor VRN1 Protein VERNALIZATION 1 [Vigna angularis]
MASQILRTDATLPIFFFKVILKTNLERLKIPNKFTRKYGDGLPNPLLMKLSNGTAWEVKWAKHNREVWLEKGWKEFVQHYSLDHGHLVCFKYEGTSQIHVIIFDQSAVEIDYFCGTDDENDNLVQTEDTADENDNLVQTEDKPNMILDEETQQKAEQIGGENYAQRTSSLNWPTQTRAREIASNFVSCNPFFTVFIKPCHERQYRLCVPDLKDIIGSKKCAVLQLGERSWKVKLLHSTERFRQYRFGAGYYLFSSESELQSGDVCVFELISTKDCVFKVHVFKIDH